ncbi:tRNA (guanosine(46)-N7)-methyltransferase TrmB [Clostridium cochlearium]|jgi:tRNA (guanine-N7-)-methyltransferase|uniref:tRNA (guanine-N(7)-)-methyltransferase n=1 Tax=Clostridium cochlearium TaxID=1494 RepID=A0A239ZI44_CLOCO|nr:tRNA (guanosine(46)-N7)-methyltransferase TrmB [Clostridium cochlearium]MBV1821158.1 tRNA (guanosine(46)-N7)-methyltransferase TrmB [Bacteroidales bacterium MSK.15.36]MBE6063930.1 tRNA (guanosine(46)-N7)-methyltransferase TrmB [Clostridium cochlearium]MBU5269111.1 tRNA (guanosine(46)-N7)-methyltransferase TrmB [Clostridium cochlearium]MCG4571105.1 tRNA (guanosine(46)-N7)-methyltransferase TrmB [Clostridium cochlearium]MCR1971402.1 tRNA (guanosine(46)-N7)-methyltransferase TrmB [Clostridium 
MRLRKKWWARPEMEASPLVITNPIEYKGKWKEEFKNNNTIHLELGCGRGGFIQEKALQNPNINYVAVDLKDEILIYVLRKIKEKEIENVRIVPLNIAFISEIFEKDEVEKIYINFCNPWPKLRHNKRRLTHNKFLDEYKKFLKIKGEIWFKTDDIGLFEDSQEYFKESGFSIEYITYDLHKSDFKHNIMTEYESKFTNMGMKTMFLIAKFK